MAETPRSGSSAPDDQIAEDGGVAIVVDSFARQSWHKQEFATDRFRDELLPDNRRICIRDGCRGEVDFRRICGYRMMNRCTMTTNTWLLEALTCHPLSSSPSQFGDAVRLLLTPDAYDRVVFGAPPIFGRSLPGPTSSGFSCD